MKRFFKAAWNTVNYHESQTHQFSTRNMHKYDNLHSALKELRANGDCEIHYLNCKSTKQFYAGKIDHLYTPTTDELYSKDLTIEIERNLHKKGLVVFYKFRAARFYTDTPVRRKLQQLAKSGQQISGEHHEFYITVLRDLSLQDLFPLEKEISFNLYSPFSALKALEGLATKLKLP